MEYITQFFSGLNSNLANVNLSQASWKAFAVVALVFLLVLVLAKMRRHYIDYSFKGAVFGIFFGFLLALVLEGFLIIGGRTAITELLGWKDAPKPLQIAIDSGRSKLVQVLGVTDQIPSSFASENPDTNDAISLFQSLDPSETKKVKALVCEP